jgi:hypothetical protein
LELEIVKTGYFHDIYDNASKSLQTTILSTHLPICFEEVYSSFCGGPWFKIQRKHTLCSRRASSF